MRVGGWVVGGGGKWKIISVLGCVNDLFHLFAMSERGEVGGGGG